MHLIAWYQRCGEPWLRPRVRSWAERLRVEPGAIEVADLGHKWGSATAGRRVRIHWATLQLSPPLVDYVLAHELAHLREAHHGPAFWQLLARVMPDYDQARRAAVVRRCRDRQPRAPYSLWSRRSSQSIDLLSFDAVASTVADALFDEGLDPVALGLSGAWGSGKTTVLGLVAQELASQGEEGSTRCW